MNEKEMILGVSKGNQNREEIRKCWTLSRYFEGELVKPDINIPWDKTPIQKRIA